jgi:hypothetical protein
MRRVGNSLYSKEEKKLEGYLNKLDEIEIPETALDQAIEAGFHRAKQERKPRKGWIMTVALAAILLLGFFTTIRISPAFANYIAEIPGMEKIVELIRHDKGLMTAIENEYYQELGVSVDKNGLEVVIDGAIADENGLVLFYTLNTDEKQKEISTGEPSLTALDGGKMVVGTISYGFPHHSEKGEYSYSGTLEYFFQEPLTAREFQLDLTVEGDTVDEEVSLTFKLQDEISPKKTYTLNETVTIEGQQIHFLDAIVYPLRVAVHVKMDPENTKKLLEFEDLRLVDENGETWSKINNGTTASKISDDETIYYLQSNYFNEPEKLFLVFNKIQAVEKEHSAVVVDTEKGEILSQPNGNKLRDLEIRGSNIGFSLYTKEEFHYGLFSEVTDGEGKKIDIDSSWSRVSDDGGINQVGVSIPNLRKYPNPISLELSFFPAWIEGEGKIRIK